MNTFKLNNGWEVDLQDQVNHDMTGGIYFEMDDGNDWNNDGFELSLWFACGPEVSEGYLSDFYNFYDKLEEILPFASIGDSENMHNVFKSSIDEYLGREVAFNEAKDIVRDILAQHGI